MVVRCGHLPVGSKRTIVTRYILTMHSHSIRIPAIVEAVTRGRRVAAVSQGMVESLHHGEMSELASVLLQVAHDEAEAAIVEW